MAEQAGTAPVAVETVAYWGDAAILTLDVLVARNGRNWPTALARLRQLLHTHWAPRHLANNTAGLLAKIAQKEPRPCRTCRKQIAVARMALNVNPRARQALCRAVLQLLERGVAL